MPPHIQQSPSSDQIHRYYIDQTARPRVEMRHPTVNWKRVWLNIGNKTMTSVQRSSWYLLVNEKLEHRELWHTIRRADNQQCTHCNSAIETLKHKLSGCRRVAPAWSHLQSVLSTVTDTRRRFSFDELLHPVLERIGNRQKQIILKHFINYVTFIMSCDNAVDVGELDFYLQVEL